MGKRCAVPDCTDSTRYSADEFHRCKTCRQTVCGYHAGIADHEGKRECSPCIVRPYYEKDPSTQVRPMRVERKRRAVKKRSRDVAKNRHYFKMYDAFTNLGPELFDNGGKAKEMDESARLFWAGYRDTIPSGARPKPGTIAYDSWAAGRDCAIHDPRRDKAAATVAA